MDKMPDEPALVGLRYQAKAQRAIAFTEQMHNMVVVNEEYKRLLSREFFAGHALRGHPQEPCLELVITHELTHVQLRPGAIAKEILRRYPKLADLVSHNKTYYKTLNENWEKVKRSL